MDQAVALNPIVRDARPTDQPTILDFNTRLAFETEGKTLDPAVLSQGVASALADPDRLRYWVAEDETTRRVVGQAAITREWTDWRNGWLWWYQSVYVHPDFRNRGVFRVLHQHIRSLALEARDVIGLRLYVEKENHRAQQTYQNLGLRPGGYLVFEEIWLNRFGRD
jgi:GNAT superfamily N-acetyltransferase